MPPTNKHIYNIDFSVSELTRHVQCMQGVPVLRDTSAVLLCKSVSVNTVGDHSVWYGKVLHAYTNGAVLEPLLYYAKLACLCCIWQFKVINTVEKC